MNRETLRKLAASQIPSSMGMIQRSGAAPAAAPPIAPAQSVTTQPTGANKKAALRTNLGENVPAKKTDTFDHAFKEQSPDTHKTDIQCSSMGGKVGSEKLKGGLADGKKPSDFDPKELDKGMKVEREHSTEENVQKEVAMDHLTEDPAYYEKLKKIEKNAKEHCAKKSKEKRDFTIDNGGKFPEYSLRGEVKEAAGPVRMAVPGNRQMPTAPRAGTAPQQAGQQAAANRFGIGGATATGIQHAPQTASGLDLAWDPGQLARTGQAPPQNFTAGVRQEQGMPGQLPLRAQQPTTQQKTQWNPAQISGIGADMPVIPGAPLRGLDKLKAMREQSTRPPTVASLYEDGVNDALAKFAAFPLVAGGLAAARVAAPHIGKWIAGKAAPMALNAGLSGLQSKTQGGTFMQGAIPGAVQGAIPGMPGQAAAMGAGMMMNR